MDRIVTHLHIDNNYIDDHDGAGGSGLLTSSEICYEACLDKITVHGSFITTERSISKIHEKILKDLGTFTE